MAHPPDGPPGALSPKDWRAIVDYDKWHDVYTPNDGVALHHGGGTDYASGRAPFSVAKEIQQLQQWESFHIYGRGWRGLAYGWAVGQTGTIFRARGWHIYGAHTGDLDGDGIANNKEIVPIIFLGSGHHHTLSPAAQDAIVRLRRWIETHSPKAKRLYGHQELKGTVTSCPGPKLMTYVKANRLLGPASTPEEDMTPEQAKKLDEIHAGLSPLVPAIRTALLLAPIGNSGKNLAQHLQDTRNIVIDIKASPVDPVAVAAQIAEALGPEVGGIVAAELKKLTLKAT